MDKNKPPKGLTKKDLQHWREEVKYIRPHAGKEIIEAEDESLPDFVPDNQSEISDTVPLPYTVPKVIPIKKPNFPYLVCNDSSYVDKNLANKLRSGKLKIEATLDLHGYFQHPAMDKLTDFIAMSSAANKRCVKVITGKGKDAPNSFGVLYENVPKWLNLAETRPYIVMFCYAQPRDGGQGALYILLKRQR